MTVAASGQVAVTGIGVLSPVGLGRRAFRDALREGRTGFREISVFDPSAYAVHVAGEVDFDPVGLLGKKGLRTLDRSTRLVVAAAGFALEDAGLAVDEANAHTVGVSLGTTFGSLHSISQFDREGLIEGPRYVNPSFFSNTVINSPASQVSIRYKLTGFNTTISTGACSGLDAVAYGAEFLHLGRAQVVLAGGVEELCEETLEGLLRLGCLSGSDGSPPRCCPFDRRRNGIVLSEGASIFVLENLEHALGRGARVLALLAGIGSAFGLDGDGRPGYSRKGLVTAMTRSLHAAGRERADVGYVSASANSTRTLDALETLAIKQVFGESASRVPVTAIKSMLGESLSASGALALASAVCAIADGYVPPTVNYREPDDACDLSYVTAAREENVSSALVVASDPFGHNAAAVVEHYGR